MSNQSIVAFLDKRIADDHPDTPETQYFVKWEDGVSSWEHESQLRGDLGDVIFQKLYTEFSQHSTSIESAQRLLLSISSDDEISGSTSPPKHRSPRHSPRRSPLPAASIVLKKGADHPNGKDLSVLSESKPFPVPITMRDITTARSPETIAQIVTKLVVGDRQSFTKYAIRTFNNQALSSLANYKPIEGRVSFLIGMEAWCRSALRKQNVSLVQDILLLIEILPISDITSASSFSKFLREPIVTHNQQLKVISSRILDKWNVHSPNAIGVGQATSKVEVGWPSLSPRDVAPQDTPLPVIQVPHVVVSVKSDRPAFDARMQSGKHMDSHRGQPSDATRSFKPAASRTYGSSVRQTRTNLSPPPSSTDRRSPPDHARYSSDYHRQSPVVEDRSRSRYSHVDLAVDQRHRNEKSIEPRSAGPRNDTPSNFHRPVKPPHSYTRRTDPEYAGYDYDHNRSSGEFSRNTSQSAPPMTTPSSSYKQDYSNRSTRRFNTVSRYEETNTSSRFRDQDYLSGGISSDATSYRQDYSGRSSARSDKASCEDSRLNPRVPPVEHFRENESFDKRTESYNERSYDRGSSRSTAVVSEKSPTGPDYSYSSGSGYSRSDRPVRPAQDRPVRPAQDRPVRPTQERPIRPVQDHPVRPVQERPVRPVQERSVRPVDDRFNPPTSTPGGSHVRPSADQDEPRSSRHDYTPRSPSSLKRKSDDSFSSYSGPYKAMRLSEEERRLLIERGCCLYCRKPGHSIDNCRTRPPRAP